MATQIYIGSFGDACDKCGKTSSEENPSVKIVITARHWQDRQRVVVCAAHLTREIAQYNKKQGKLVII